MTIHLTPQLEAKVEQLLATGRYAAAEEVMAEALRLLDEQERRFADLRAKIQVGIDEADRGETDEWTPELRARLRDEAIEMDRLGEQPDPDVCP